MTFVQAVGSALRQYASFKGRASRAEFWYFLLFAGLVVFVTAAIDALAGITLAYPIAVVAIILPLLAVAVRRLHDTDRAGWYYLLFVVPIIGLVLYYFWAQRGTPGPNRFGPPPGDDLVAGQSAR